MLSSLDNSFILLSIFLLFQVFICIYKKMGSFYAPHNISLFKISYLNISFNTIVWLLSVPIDTTQYGIPK